MKARIMSNMCVFQCSLTHGVFFATLLLTIFQFPAATAIEISTLTTNESVVVSGKGNASPMAVVTITVKDMVTGSKISKVYEGFPGTYVVKGLEQNKWYALETKVKMGHHVDLKQKAVFTRNTDGSRLNNDEMMSDLVDWSFTQGEDAFQVNLESLVKDSMDIIMKLHVHCSDKIRTKTVKLTKNASKVLLRFTKEDPSVLTNLTNEIKTEAKAGAKKAYKEITGADYKTQGSANNNNDNLQQSNKEFKCTGIDYSTWLSRGAANYEALSGKIDAENVVDINSPEAVDFNSQNYFQDVAIDNSSPAVRGGGAIICAAVLTRLIL